MHWRILLLRSLSVFASIFFAKQSLRRESSRLCEIASSRQAGLNKDKLGLAPFFRKKVPKKLRPPKNHLNMAPRSLKELNSPDLSIGFF